jgi:hypothetical protein
MYLFYRSVRLRMTDVRDQLTWATAITEKVNHISETPVSLWTSVFSPGSGTLTWTTFADSLAVLEANNDKLLVDNSYLDLVDQAGKWDSGQAIDDGLLQYVVAPEQADQPPAYTTVVRATLAPGHYARGVEVGIEIAARAKHANGAHTSFASAMTGAYGEVSWLTGFDSIEAMEEAQQKLGGDMSFVSYIDSDASEAYLPGATTQTIYRRII